MASAIIPGYGDTHTHTYKVFVLFFFFFFFFFYRLFTLFDEGACSLTAEPILTAQYVIRRRLVRVQTLF